MLTATGESQLRGVIAAHGASVFSVALRIVADRAAAEEIAQDVFLELWRTRPYLATAEHLRHWLRRVAAHRATDYLRRRAVRPTLVLDGWLESVQCVVSQEQDGLPEALSARLDDLLASLPESLRVPLVLRYGENDMSPEEIAAMLGHPVATVKSNLQRGLAMLRRKAEITLKEYVRHA